MFPFFLRHVLSSGQSVSSVVLSRRQHPSFPRRSPRPSFPAVQKRSVGAGLTTRSSEQRLAARLFCCHRLSSPASVAELEFVGRLGRFSSADRVSCTSEGVSSAIDGVSSRPEGVSSVTQEPSCIIDGVSSGPQGVSCVIDGVSSGLEGASSSIEGVSCVTDGVSSVSQGVPSATQGVASTPAGVSPGHALSQPPNHALQRTGHGGTFFLIFHPLRRHGPSLSLEALGALPLCSVCEVMPVPVRFAGSACSRSPRGRVLPFGSVASFGRPFPAAAPVIPPPVGGRFPFPAFRSHAPNNALQRTEAGGGAFSAIHVLRRQPPSLSLEALGGTTRTVNSPT